jgi:hypothetical protein
MIRNVVLRMLSDSDIRERLGPLTDPTNTPDQIPRRPPAGLIATLAILVVLLWGAGAAAIVHLERISPRVPEPASGHVYRFSDTRHTVYLTATEQYVAWGAIGVPILSTLVVTVFGFWRKKPRVELG